MLDIKAMWLPAAAFILFFIAAALPAQIAISNPAFPPGELVSYSASH